MTPTSEHSKSEKSEARILLHELEATKKYVFHGSPNPDTQELELRQPHDFSTGKKEKHGEPCIAASPYADIAIFRAVMRHDYTGFGSHGRTLEFRATQKALDHAKNKTGYVYVLSRGDFLPLHGNANGMEWRAKKSQRPIRIIRVSFDDLPENITLIHKPF